MFSLETLSKFIQTSGLRKVSVAIHYFNVLAFLVYKGKITPEFFAETTFYLIFAVFGGNVIEHITKAKKNGGKFNVPSPVSETSSKAP